MNLQQIIEAAQGYYLLGMLQDAEHELEQLPSTVQYTPEVLNLRVSIRMARKEWAGALRMLTSLCKLFPEASENYLHAAYCLHEVGRTEEAKSMLLSGPTSLKKNPLYYYNLACYETRLGNLDTARSILKLSFKLDGACRKMASTDPDLKPLGELPD